MSLQSDVHQITNNTGDNSCSCLVEMKVRSHADEVGWSWESVRNPGLWVERAQDVRAA